MADSLLTPILSAVVSAGVSYYVSVYLKDKEYKNDYYKKVIDKRLAAYQLIETLISELEYSAVDTDSRNYHIVFHDNETTYKAFVKHLHAAVKSKMWLSAHAEKQVSYLNKQVYQASKRYDFNKPDEIRAAGKECFETIQSMNAHLKQHLWHDMRYLHDSERFFTSRG